MANARIHMLPPEVVDEERLLEALRAGSPEAFHSLYRLYLPKVAGLCRLLLRDVGVDDAIQDTFLRVFRNIQQFRGDSRLTTWVHRIATNVCLSELRQRGVWRARHDDLADEPDDGRDVEAEFALKQSSEQLQVLLDALDPIKRTTFFLHHVEGLTAAEIGIVLGEQRGTVLKRLQRTREDLLARWTSDVAAKPLGSAETSGGRP
jgi:RNA polymerase sigma-70 factor (ECF subfamily)